jgi:hypothetical protein
MKKFVLFFLFIYFVSSVFSLSVSVHVPEKYLEVNPGERLYFEISVKYPENPQRKDLRLNYLIRDSSNEILVRSKVLKAIETQASFVDFVVLPENIESGLYFVEINLEDYEDLSESVSSSFNVVQESFFSIRIYFLIILGGVFLMGFFIILFFIKSK